MSDFYFTERLDDKISMKEYLSLSKKFYQLEKTYQDDKKFYMIALNLSKNRNKLEQRAMKLIDKIGLIKAIKKSRIY